MNPLEGMTLVVSDDDEHELTALSNKANRDNVIEYWCFGPEETTSDNVEFWRKMGKVWDINENDARRRLCSNCTHFDNSPDTLEMLEQIEEDDYDADGSGRGYCMKFEFICHNLRVCQAWKSDDCGH